MGGLPFPLGASKYCPRVLSVISGIALCGTYLNMRLTRGELVFAYFKWRKHE